MTAASQDQWYWCLTHKKAEPADTSCPPNERMGPYPSQAAAEKWQEQVERRNEEWDEEDREWEGDD